MIANQVQVVDVNPLFATLGSKLNGTLRENVIHIVIFPGDTSTPVFSLPKSRIPDLLAVETGVS